MSTGENIMTGQYASKLLGQLFKMETNLSQIATCLSGQEARVRLAVKEENISHIHVTAQLSSHFEHGKTKPVRAVQRPKFQTEHCSTKS